MRPVTASIVLAVIAREMSVRMVSSMPFRRPRRRSGPSMLKVGAVAVGVGGGQGPGGGRRGQGEVLRALALLSMVM